MRGPKRWILEGNVSNKNVATLFHLHYLRAAPPAVKVRERKRERESRWIRVTEKRSEERPAKGSREQRTSLWHIHSDNGRRTFRCNYFQVLPSCMVPIGPCRGCRIARTWAQLVRQSPLRLRYQSLTAQNNGWSTKVYQDSFLSWYSLEWVHLY